jgi:hypothetical protein
VGDRGARLMATLPGLRVGLTLDSATFVAETRRVNDSVNQMDAASRSRTRRCRRRSPRRRGCRATMRLPGSASASCPQGSERWCDFRRAATPPADPTRTTVLKSSTAKGKGAARRTPPCRWVIADFKARCRRAWAVNKALEAPETVRRWFPHWTRLASARSSRWLADARGSQ